MQFFRLLNRQTKSEGDVSTLVSQPGPAGLPAPVLVTLQAPLTMFEPTHELYESPGARPCRILVDSNHVDELKTRIIQLESRLAHLEDERSTLEHDVADFRTDLLHTRTELYSEMLSSSRHRQRAMDEFRTVQKLEARHQRFCNLLVDIGIPRPTVDTICQVIQSGHGSPEDVLVDAIKHASNDRGTLLSRIKPVIAEERTPEHYQSALNMTLNVRKELKSQKKRSNFWKKLAQEDGRHVDIITPSPSNISSIRQELSPERHSALDALVTRRRTARYSEGGDSDVFGGRRESALDTLASSLASRPRHSIPDDLRLSSSFSSSASSASTYFSGVSRIPRDSITETPVIPSRLPSPLSTSLRRSSRSTSQSVVLGSINLNVSRSSSIGLALPEEMEQQENPDTVPMSTVTLSQDLLQNDRRASQEHGHRRISSAASRRSTHARSTRSSFRLSAFSPMLSYRANESLAIPDSDISENTAVDTSSLQTPDMMMRQSNTNSGSDTPASSEVTTSEDTPFNDSRILPKFGVDTPLSEMELEPRVASTPLDESASLKPLAGEARARDTRFVEHLDSSTFMSMSSSESVTREDSHPPTDSGASSIPVDESKDSLFTTTSASSLSGNDTPAPTTPPTPSPSPAPEFGSPSSSPSSTRKSSIGRSMLPVLAKHLRRLSLSGASPDRERLVEKLRGLRSLSKSRSRSRSGSSSGSPPTNVRRVWRGSPARSDSSRRGNLTPSPSPVKGSGIPVLQRRLTIRARRTSVRKIE